MAVLRTTNLQEKATCRRTSGEIKGGIFIPGAARDLVGGATARDFSVLNVGRTVSDSEIGFVGL